MTLSTDDVFAPRSSIKPFGYCVGQRIDDEKAEYVVKYDVYRSVHAIHDEQEQRMHEEYTEGELSSSFKEPAVDFFRYI